jgi:transcription-repair coupling factor (superfamily II helicase)
MAAEQLPTQAHPFSGYLDALAKGHTFDEVLAWAKEFSTISSGRLYVGDVEGIRPALVAELARARASARSCGANEPPICVIVASQREADELAAQVRSWWDFDPSAVAVLDAWETLPHERLSPRADTVAKRMAVFRRLAHPVTTGEGSEFGPIRVLIMPVRSFIQPVVPHLGDIEPLIFKVGNEFEMTRAVEKLVENAYSRVELVMNRGEFAVRGGIIDVFPPTAAHPVRIEFFGDEIDTIYEFHSSDQRTYGEVVEQVWATACREVPLTAAVRARAKSLIGKIANADDMLESISQGIPVEGMESLLPVLVDELVPVSSLLDGGSAGKNVKNVKNGKPLMVLCDVDRLERSSDDLVKTANEFLAASWHVAASGGKTGAPITFDSASFQDFDDALDDIESGRVGEGASIIELSSFGVDGGAENRVQLHVEAPEQFRGDEKRAETGIEGLIEKKYAIVITAATKGILSRLKHMMSVFIGAPKIDYVQSPQLHGFIDSQSHIVLLTENDITGKQSKSGGVKTSNRKRKSLDLLELKPGDFIVHDQHGIGRFVELQQRDVGSGANKSHREYLVIEYAATKRGAPADKLFVPTDQLDQLSKYIGADLPKLNKLGGSDWATTKAKARSHVKKIAQDLVKLYSARQASAGFAFSPDTPWQRDMEDAFEFEETPDQLTTIEEVKADMEKPIPMDRLVSGDVGFGKTEIAVRAAFKAVQDGKQVAVLVPTTLLVEQHLETFTSRFEGFPVNVAPLSRFQNAKESAATIAGLEDGSVDVVIGTHKLLNPRIKFKDLGLVIIDEEQRFGVEHKETLKALRTNVDVLSMSATPIPRTLEMAVTGIREMSTLTTPPEDRLPILTFVGAYEDAQVVAAIRRELLRGGQVFFVHNRVSDIDSVAAHISELVPEARIGIGHGKMTEKQLDGVIRDFWARQIDVLVCTTIIETGLDISNANTLIVDNADRYGLSQLHQLRGRVGRGSERAYAYFLYQPRASMTQAAHDRLTTIAQNTALGSGFDVAMKDLELRGTGNLLGAEQSGHIEGVGFDLYVRMVSEAVEEYKQPERHEAISVTIDLPVEASIPTDYIDSDKLRLEAYRKIAQARNDDDFEEIRDELADRYGQPPAQLATLFDVARLRNKAREIGVSEIVTQGNKVRFAKLELPESLQMRMMRLYKGSVYRPVTRMLLVPAPFAGGIGGHEMDSQEIIAWTNKVLDNLAR